MERVMTKKNVPECVYYLGTPGLVMNHDPSMKFDRQGS